jgi:hypothetical protein
MEMIKSFWLIFIACQPAFFLTPREFAQVTTAKGQCITLER